MAAPNTPGSMGSRPAMMEVDSVTPGARVMPPASPGPKGPPPGDVELLARQLRLAAQEKQQLIGSLEEVVGMYGSLKAQYQGLLQQHTRLQAEHDEIVRDAAAVPKLSASAASSGAGLSPAAAGDEEEELTNEERLERQVADLRLQITVAINAKIMATKKAQVAMQKVEAKQKHMDAEVARLKRELRDAKEAQESMQKERKALLHYAQSLESDVTRMKIESDEGRTMKGDSDALRAMLQETQAKLQQLQEAWYKSEHTLEWLQSAPSEKPEDYEEFAMKAEQELHKTKFQLARCTSIASHVQEARAIKAEDDLKRITALLWDLAELAEVDVRALRPGAEPADGTVLAVSDGGQLGRLLHRKLRHQIVALRAGLLTAPDSDDDGPSAGGAELRPTPAALVPAHVAAPALPAVAASSTPTDSPPAAEAVAADGARTFTPEQVAALAALSERMTALEANIDLAEAAQRS